MSIVYMFWETLKAPTKLRSRKLITNAFKGKKNPHSLLMGLKHGATTIGVCVDTSQNVKHKSTI